VWHCMWPWHCIVSDHLFQQLTKLGFLSLGHVGVGWAGDAFGVALLPCAGWAR
jgi:hypothetical protein